MTHWYYLLAILGGLIGVAIIDWRYKLAFWYDCRRALKTIAAATTIFILWDVLGIILGIFRHGNSRYQLPFTLFAEFPLEELFFLILLTYCTLVLYTGVSRWRSRM